MICMKLYTKIFLALLWWMPAIVMGAGETSDSLSVQEAKKDSVTLSVDTLSSKKSRKHREELSEKEMERRRVRDSIMANRSIYCWRSEGPIGFKTEGALDTSMAEFYINNHALKETVNLQTLGNLGSPSQSAIFADRYNKTDFIFFQPYQLFYRPIDEIQYYNTKDPFSYVDYYGGGTHNRDNRFIDGLFTVNAGAKLNFGMYGNWTKAYGAYQSSSTKYHNIGFFSSYQGGSFEYMAAISINGFESYESGGFLDDRYISDPKNTGNMDPANIPVFSNENAFNKVRNWNAYLNLKKHFGFEKEVSVAKDSFKYEFVPVTSIIYTFESEADRRRYYERSLDPSGINVDSFYHAYGLNDKPLWDSLKTVDSTRFWHMKHAVGITLNEEFNKLMRFGLAAYVTLDVKKYTALDKERSLATGPVTHYNDSLGYLMNPVYTSTYKQKMGIGAKLSKHSGEAFTYDFFGEYYFLDEKERAGSLRLGGALSSKANWGKQRVEIEANVSYDRECPDYFEEHYFSNHIEWNRDFDYKNTFSVDGTLRFPTFAFYDKIGLSATATMKNLSNYIYWDRFALPAQYDGTIQVLSFAIRERASVWRFHWDNDLVLQKCSNNSILPLPSINWYSAAYFRFDKLFKVLNLQIGVDGRWNSAYYAPNYLPATGQFFLQNPESEFYQKYGEYLYMNAFVNFHLKRARFYLEMNHLNKLWTNKYNSLYMRGYAMDPSYLKFGLSLTLAH